MNVAFFDRQVAECTHHLAEPNILNTVEGAITAEEAKPNGTGGEDLVFHSV
jgi:hypothetical protein